MVHHDLCPLCSSGDISLYLNVRDHFLSGEYFPVFSCRKCGFEFSQDYPDEAEIGRYYESADYLSHNNSAGGFTAGIYRIARDLMVQRKRRLIEKISGLKSGTILDIGSGSGYFASAMKNGGWKAMGIEINEKAREASVSRLGLDVIDPADISTLKSSSFDCITLWHVLEHFHDPSGYADEISRLLKPGGICILALPNSNSYDAIHYAEFWAAYDVPRHLWHFNPDTFGHFSEKAGLLMKKIKTLPLDVFYISSLSEKYKGSSFSFLRGISRAFCYFGGSLFRKEKSSSVVYILNKKDSQNLQER